MSDAGNPAPGTILWRDLTVENAEAVRDFYKLVIGWDSKPEDMGGYEDYHMIAPSTGDSAAGICHARGTNSDLPPQWLVYVIVEDVDVCATKCREAGGEVVAGPRDMGAGRFCVIRDPAGAVLALYDPEP